MSKNVSVRRRADESDESLIERFQREVSRSGILQQVRSRSHFMTKKEKRILKRSLNQAKK